MLDLKRHSKVIIPYATNIALLTAAYSLPIAGVRAEGQTPITTPLSASKNPHYFKNGEGRAIALYGSQSWNTFQDWGTDGKVEPTDFNSFLQFLTTHGHNFTLLWTVEMPKLCSLPTTTGTPPVLSVSPMPYMRTGPGNASDGGPKFDLTAFDQSYFDRLRERTKLLGNAGIYAGVYIFIGETLNIFRCSDDGFPLTGANNINGIDDGYSGGTTGVGATNMSVPNALTKVQDAFIEKMIDTLNDLPNVLWVVSEEASPQSLWWNEHLISHVREYELKKPYHHPIGYAAPVHVRDAVVYNSNADWVAPYALVSPAASCGAGKPSCKVNINDSDHSYFGMWNETPQQNRNYAWENFTTGNHVLFMDPYTLEYRREKRNSCIRPTNGICKAPDPRYDNFRDNLGYILKYSRKLNLIEAAPSDTLCSTGFCLAQTPNAGAEYLVYAPTGETISVDLSAMQSSRKLNVEWFNPATGETVMEKPIAAGSKMQTFNPPFSGDAVLYLVDVEGHATSERRVGR